MHTWKQPIAHGQHTIHMQPCSITTIHETLWSAQCGSGRKPRLGVIADASRLEPPYTTNESLNKLLARAINIGPKQCWIVLRVLIRQVCRVRLLRAGSESSHSTRTRSLLDPAWPIVDTPLRGRLKRSRTQSHTMPHAATDPHQFTSSRTNKPCRTRAHQYHSYMRHTPSRARHRPTRSLCARAPTAHPAHSHHPIAALAPRAHAPPTPARTPQAWHLRRTISSTRERQWACALPIVSWRQTIRGKPTGGLCNKRGDKYFRKIYKNRAVVPNAIETIFV